MDNRSTGAANLATEIELPALVARLHFDVATGEVARDEGAISLAVAGAAPWLSQSESSEVVRRVLGRVGGLGEIDELLHDDEVTDILVDGPGAVVVERLGQLVSSGLVLDHDGVMTLVEQLASAGDRRVDHRHPISDLRLPGGFRVNIVVPPVAVGGPYVSIRRFRTSVADLEHISDEFSDFLHGAIDERRNVVVSGSTGSGKTTLLGAMVGACAPSERVVVIEDVVEMPANRPLVRLEAQPGDGEGRTAVTIRELLRGALRMRPDRLVIGEVRGAEAVDLLQALGTGHRGSMATIHADDPASAMRRLELLCAAEGTVEPSLVKDQLRDVVDFVVHMQRQPGGRRRIAAIGEIGHGGLSSVSGEVGRW